MQHLQPNTTLQGGKYRIERVLGQGGFGITYMATLVSSNRQVAIKELFLNGVNERAGNSIRVSNSTNDSLFEKQKEKFKKEAKRIMSLDNEHIVKVYDLFEENNTVYYVMDYLEGESLASKMQREGHPLTESEVMDILPQLLDALSEIHKYQIWHLDIKPANIMLIDKTVVLIDFGASKQITPSEMTSTALYFTPGYAPAEQTGMLFNQFGPWTDLYAVGATIFNLLTGKSPLEFDIEEFKEDDLPESNLGLMYKMVNWMMQPRRKERPQTAVDVKQKYYVDLVSIGVISISKEVLQKEIVKVKGEDIDLVKDLVATKKQIDEIQKEIKELFGADIEGYPMTHDCIVVAILQQLGWLFDIGNEESDDATYEDGDVLENLVKEQNKILESRSEQTILANKLSIDRNQTYRGRECNVCGYRFGKTDKRNYCPVCHSTDISVTFQNEKISLSIDKNGRREETIITPLSVYENVKVKKGLRLSNVCGENVIVDEEKGSVDYDNIISMNETSAYLWNIIQDKEAFNAEYLATLLTQEYEVNKETALMDTKAIIQQWYEFGIIEKTSASVRNDGFEAIKNKVYDESYTTSNISENSSNSGCVVILLIIFISMVSVLI